MSRTKIEINPNLRVNGDQTVVDLDEDVYGPPPRFCEEVTVFERTSGLLGRAWVGETDQMHRTIVLTVDWSTLKIPDGTRVATVPGEQANFIISGVSETQPV